MQSVREVGCTHGDHTDGLACVGTTASCFVQLVPRFWPTGQTRGGETVASATQSRRRCCSPGPLRALLAVRQVGPSPRQQTVPPTVHLLHGDLCKEPHSLILCRVRRLRRPRRSSARCVCTSQGAAAASAQCCVPRCGPPSWATACGPRSDLASRLAALHPQWNGRELLAGLGACPGGLSTVLQRRTATV